MIVITGGTGHLGVQLIPLLTARGHEVRVLTRDPRRARSLLGAGPELVTGDVREPHSLEHAVSGADAVVSAITGFGPGAPGPRAVDYLGNLNLIRAAEAAGVNRFILLSMHGAAAGHPMELLRMKHRAEEALRQSRLDWTIVRPTVFMELWAGIVGDSILKSGKATVFGRGDNPVNFVSVTDVARIVELAVVEPSLSRQAIDVGGPENLTFNQLVAQIESLTGRRAAVRHVPVPVMRFARLLLRPVRPDLAGMVEAGLIIDTTDMSLDVAALRQRFPQVAPTSMRAVLQERCQTQPQSTSTPRR